jgi:hypothetical protein
MRLEPLRERIGLPVLNDSPIKQFAENEHAVGQSVLESFLRLTNRSTNGKRVTVFGYGACGRGVAANFRNAYAIVSVVEADPVKRLQALLDGFLVPEREEALRSADVVITVTGARDVVTAADEPLLKDGAVLANAGHFPFELDAAGISAGGRVTVLEDGHMVNLAGPRPLGNSIESMDLGFALQARCLEAVATGAVGRGACVVPVPRFDRRTGRRGLRPLDLNLYGLSRQMSVPFQLGTHAWPLTFVTTNGPTPTFTVAETVLEAGSTIATRLRVMIGTQTLPATTSGSPAFPDGSFTVAATAFVCGSILTSPAGLVTHTASLDAAVHAAPPSTGIVATTLPEAGSTRTTPF